MSADAGAPRESAAWVLGIGLGLALIGAAVAALLLVRARPLDPAAALAGSFELGALPFGMRLDAALALPGGETVVVLTDGRELASDPLETLAADDVRQEPSQEEPAREGERGPGANKPDWAALPELAPGGPPARLYLVRHPRERAEAALDRAFRRVQWKELSELEAKGGRLAVEGGRLEWGRYAADYVRERRFLPGPAFEDALRVNLALPGRYWIAYAFWPRDHAGSKEPVEELLAALAPTPPDE